MNSSVWFRSGYASTFLICLTVFLSPPIVHCNGQDASKSVDDDSSPTQTKVDFARDIQPLLESHCADCHNEDDDQAGLRVDQRAKMLRGGDSGVEAIIPGEPAKSYLIEMVRSSDEDIRMPLDEDPLSEDEIQLLERWIQEGAVWPGQMDAVAEPEPTDLWSFQPVVQPPIPKLMDLEVQPPNAVDAFLQHQLAEKGLTYNPPADPRRLIRRVSVVLTGLMPTTRQVNDFLDAYQQDPDHAYEALVERLLDSSHFGERWAQHWLDVIRWAETNGSESNLYRKNAWVYRDYVIAAFNSDKPYDEFIREQIAGDAMGQDAATGFLVAGPHVPPATVGREESEMKQAYFDRMNEMVETVSASMLGVTIGCARCHNHKFDPISTRDYYSIAATFSGVEFDMRRPQWADSDRRMTEEKSLLEEIDQHRESLRSGGSWIEDWGGYQQVHFAPVLTQSLRITFRTSYATLDQIEIYGPGDPETNLALARAGAVASSFKKTADINHSQPVDYLIDGRAENFFSWSSMGKSKEPWVRIDLPEPVEVNRVELSSDRKTYYGTKYLLDAGKRFKFSKYVVEALDSDGQWTEIASTEPSDELSKLDRKSRQTIVTQINTLAEKYNSDGPQPVFVGRFGESQTMHVLNRGNPQDPRSEVAPGGLELLGGALDLPRDANEQGKRLAFANWVASHDNSLTSRVMVNRIWHHLFGLGIVATPSDFGTMGVPPTHPELLDWLASELVGNGWSTKRIIRQVVTSEAFRQSSAVNPKAMAADADALLLWRFPPRRVEAEVIRDSMLQAAGTLDLSRGGRSYRIHADKKRYAQWKMVDNAGPSTWRRMIYQERMRRVDDQMFMAFDFPDCGQVLPKRSVSTTPLQALNLFNGPVVTTQSDKFAKRVIDEIGDDPEAQIKRVFEIALCRHPEQAEITAAQKMVKIDGLASFCRVVFNTNEFVFID